MEKGQPGGDAAGEADKLGIGEAEKQGVAGPEGGWTPAKGGRRQEDAERMLPSNIPTPTDVVRAKEGRDTDDQGGPDA